MCAFSEYRIYPGHGQKFIRRDGQVNFDQVDSTDDLISPSRRIACSLVHLESKASVYSEQEETCKAHVDASLATFEQERKG